MAVLTSQEVEERIRQEVPRHRDGEEPRRVHPRGDEDQVAKHRRARDEPQRMIRHQRDEEDDGGIGADRRHADGDGVERNSAWAKLRSTQTCDSQTRIPGAGNRAQHSLTSAATRSTTFSSSGADTTRSMKPASACISDAPMPRDVTDGVPMRNPDGSNGLRGSNGIEL